MQKSKTQDLHEILKRLTANSITLFYLWSTQFQIISHKNMPFATGKR